MDAVMIPREESHQTISVNIASEEKLINMALLLWFLYINISNQPWLMSI